GLDMEATQILGLLCAAALVGAVVGLALGAVVLRVACHFVGVPVPNFGRAVLIILTLAIVENAINLGIHYVVTDVLRTARIAAGVMNGPWTGTLVATAIILPINLIISAAVYSSMLDKVSFGQGVLIFLVQFLIVLLIVGIVAGITVAVMFAM